MGMMLAHGVSVGSSPQTAVAGLLQPRVRAWDVGAIHDCRVDRLMLGG